jgi:hypothetical protein
MKRCALMDCELPDDAISLGKIIEMQTNEKTKKMKRQAYILIKECGFSESDCFCGDCFYK